MPLSGELLADAPDLLLCRLCALEPNCENVGTFSAFPSCRVDPFAMQHQLEENCRSVKRDNLSGVGGQHLISGCNLDEGG